MERVRYGITMTLMPSWIFLRATGEECQQVSVSKNGRSAGTMKVASLL